MERFLDNDQFFFGEWRRILWGFNFLTPKTLKGLKNGGVSVFPTLFIKMWRLFSFLLIKKDTEIIFFREDKKMQTWYELDSTHDGQIVFIETESKPPIEVVLDHYNGVEWVSGSETWGYDEALDLYIFFYDGLAYALKVD